MQIVQNYIKFLVGFELILFRGLRYTNIMYVNVSRTSSHRPM
jgi:hypothetical protein